MEVRIAGKPASPGIGIGKAFVFVHEPAVEVSMKRLERAIRDEVVGLEKLVESYYEKGAEDEALILEAQKMVLEDEAFWTEFTSLAKEMVPGKALLAALERIGERVGRSEYMRARKADFLDLGYRILRRAAGLASPLERIGEPSVVVADELFPSETVGMRREMVLGIVTERGGVTAHAAIIARNYGIPAVVGARGVLKVVRDGALVVVDGIEGVVVANPSEGVLEEYRRRKAFLESVYREFSRRTPVRTVDGERVFVEANVGGLDDLELAAHYGAEGIGLLRTEFLFIGRETPPSVEEQERVYRDYVSRMAPFPTVFRLLDVGGDKPLPYVPSAAEPNPFLGVRGARLLLRHRSLLTDQVRAILLASKYGEVWIMAPMVSTVEEAVELRRVVEEVAADLGSRGFEPRYRFGIMVEVPSIALVADRVVEYVDFMSIGTNDLTQYVLASDRTNEALSDLYDHAHPAVLRLVDMVVRAGDRAGRIVAVCGEAGSDPEVVSLLVGLGVRHLSVAPSQIPLVRHIVSSLDTRVAREVAMRALEAENSREVRSLGRRLVKVVGEGGWNTVNS